MAFVYLFFSISNCINICSKFIITCLTPNLADTFIKGKLQSIPKLSMFFKIINIILNKLNIMKQINQNMKNIVLSNNSRTAVNAIFDFLIPLTSRCLYYTTRFLLHQVHGSQCTKEDYTKYSWRTLADVCMVSEVPRVVPRCRVLL